MKTTIDIADDLFLRSKQISKEQDVTLRELFSEGLAPEFKQASWAAIRDAAYERHDS